MSLDRKDIRAKLDPELHAALVAICETDGVDIGEFVEQELIVLIRQRIHNANLLSTKTAHLGISGNRRERAK